MLGKHYLVPFSICTPDLQCDNLSLTLTTGSHLFQLRACLIVCFDNIRNQVGSIGTSFEFKFL